MKICQLSQRSIIYVCCTGPSSFEAKMFDLLLNNIQIITSQTCLTYLSDILFCTDLINMKERKTISHSYWVYSTILSRTERMARNGLVLTVNHQDSKWHPDLASICFAVRWQISHFVRYVERPVPHLRVEHKDTQAVSKLSPSAALGPGITVLL